MELVGGSWESINSPRIEKRWEYNTRKNRQAANLREITIPFSLSHRPPNFKYSRVTRPFFSIPFPFSSFIPLLIFLFPRLIFPLVFSLPIPFLISHLSNSSITAILLPNLFAFPPLLPPPPLPSPHLAEKMSMARQKTVLHEVTGCQTFLPRLEGSSVFRSRYVSENNTYIEDVWRTRATMFAR